MILVDFIEGYAVQNQTMRCRVMANLFVYKVDRCTPDLQMEPEDMHDRFRNERERAAFIVTCNDAFTTDAKIATEKDIVSFDSDLHDPSEALRITDEGMIIADCIDNYTKHNETMPRQVLQERVMAHIFAHKVDHYTPELQMESEDVHDRFRNVMSQLQTLLR